MNTPNIPGYTDLEKIGAGGFAVVYRATQTAVGRQVALKLLHNAVADEDTEHRFRRECRVVGSLSWHPHIAAVLDAGTDADGRSYLVFELLTGGSLGDRLDRSGPIPWQDAIGFAIQTADALAAAHDEEVLHRDVKPDNILLDRLGRAKLADFGIAAMRDGTQTKTGVITATLAHAAPEVLNGQRATKLSDVYLLGSTLFQLIAGTPPFGTGAGDDFFAAIQRIALQTAPSLVSVPGLDVPPELSAVVDRALRKIPEERFESAAAMGMAMRDVQVAYGLTRTNMPFAEVHRRTPRSPTVAAPISPQPSVLPAPPLPAPPSAPLPSAPSAPLHAPPSAPPPSAPSAPLPSPAAVPWTGPPPSLGQAIDAEPESARPAKRSKAPLLAAVMALALIAAGTAAFVLSRPGSPSDAIVAVEVKQTDSAPGFTGKLVIDGDLSTGWLSPNSPNGHEIVIGFGKLVRLDSIVIHSGPGQADAPALKAARGLGAAVLEFSDGTEMTVQLNEALATQSVAIGRVTSSLAIRSIAQGVTPVAIREVEFIGSSTP